MTEQEYKLLAKRTNQRLVTAINIGTYNIEGQRIQQELYKLGFTRFPERMSRVPASKLADTIRVLQDYDSVKRFYGDLNGESSKKAEKKGRQTRNVWERTYVDKVRQVNRRMRQMEKEGLGYTEDGEEPIAVLKHMYDVLELQGIKTDFFPVNPAELPPSAAINEIVASFSLFLENELTTQKGRREYQKASEYAFTDSGETGHDYFSSREKLTKKQKLVLAYWVAVYGDLRSHANLDSDQIVEAIVILDNNNKLKGGMASVRDLQRIITAYNKNPEGSRSFIGYLQRALLGQLKHFRL